MESQVKQKKHIKLLMLLVLALLCSLSFAACGLSGDKTLYTVIFDSQGGSPVAAITGISNSSMIAEPSAPTRTGYIFGGWYNEVDAQNKWIFSTDTVTSGITLYAKWTANTYVINYLDEGGGAFSGTLEEGYATLHTYGTVTALVSPIKFPYVFVGWYIDSDCTGMALTSLPATDYTEDITLYAKWSRGLL